MICSIHQPQSFPWLGYFAKIMASDKFIFLDNVQYKKNEFQNRNKIKYHETAHWLTIPVHHKFGQYINEIKINNKTKWKRKVRNTLKTYYAKAPYFRKFFPGVEEIIDHDYDYLYQFNIDFILWVLKKLNVDTQLLVASELIDTAQLDQYTPSEKLQKLVNHASCDTYLSGIGGKNYLVEEEFTKNNLFVHYQQFSHPQYQQLGENFVSHLSVLDLFFNEGDNSRIIIEKGIQ